MGGVRGGRAVGYEASAYVAIIGNCTEWSPDADAVVGAGHIITRRVVAESHCVFGIDWALWRRRIIGRYRPLANYAHRSACPLDGALQARSGRVDFFGTCWRVIMGGSISDG